MKVDVIFAPAPAAAGAARQVTGVVPIVFAVSADPVGEGLVAGLARPGGNVTGLSTIAAELSAKRVELLKEAVPTVARLAVLLMTSRDWADRPGSGPAIRSALRATEAGARPSAMHLQLVVSPEVGDLERAFATMNRQRAQALLVFSNPLALVHRREIADLAAKNRLPSMGDWKDFAEAGGLMAYGPNLVDQYRRAAAYVDKILKGAHPEDLPVEQPARIPSGHQYEDGQGPWPQDAPVSADSGGSGDRMIRYPFTAPAVNPRMKCCDSTTYSAMMGSAASVSPENSVA